MKYTGPTRRITLEITALDIRATLEAQRRDKNVSLCDICPVAQALQRITGDFYQVYGQGRARRYEGLVEFKLPMVVHHWILNRDSGVKSSGPASFEIDIPAKEGA